MRAHYLAEDRYDIRFACHQLARDMRQPTAASMLKLKHLGRYLRGRPRMVLRYLWQRPQAGLTVYTDSDWGGCVVTRRSTSAGVVRHGAHTVKCWTSTQATVSLSSAEAEYHSAVRGCAAGLGMRSFAQDLGGAALKVRIMVDSSAAIQMARRSGLGRVRHMAVALLWLQDAVRRGDVEIAKCKGTENPSDIGTKYVPVAVLDAMLEMLGFEVRGGNARLALRAQRGGAQEEEQTA